MNPVTSVHRLGTGELLTVHPGSVNAAEVLGHDLVTVAVDSAVLPTDVLLRQDDLVAHLLSDATDQDLIALGGEGPLGPLVVADDDADHRLNPKC